jgi:surfeit locus 1 family protein
MRRFPWVLTVASLIAFAILVTLGVWQLQRLQWKEALVAEVEAAAKAPPLPLAEALALNSPAWRRAMVDCPGLATAPFVELRAIFDAGQGPKPGVRLISPCPRPNGAILVDRGFVDAEISARPPEAPSSEIVRVTGVLVPAEKPGGFTPATEGRYWFARDLPAMARALGAANPAPFFLSAETPSGFNAAKPIPPKPQLSNRHLGYVLTWFGLAAALACVYSAMLFQRLKKP